MSRFSGPQHKGAMRAHREVLHAEAVERQSDFNKHVARVKEEQNVSWREARRVAASSRRVARRVRALHGAFAAISDSVTRASEAIRAFGLTTKETSR